MPNAHRVRSLKLDIDLTSEEDALALQARLPGFGAAYLRPTIERVLDRMDRAGWHMRLDRLELDLGTLPLGDFAASLTRTLDEALEEALRQRLHSPQDGDHAVAAADAPLDLLGHYLQHGTLPYWAGDGRTFSLSAVVEDLSRGRASDLAALIMRLGDNRAVLERLAGYLSDKAFACLIQVLDPDNSGVILAYLLDLRDAHGRLPVVPLSLPDLTRLLWVLTLAWEVRDPGSQFNRKSFVQSLLQGLAMQRSVDYAALVLTLHRGLRLAVRRRQSALSLPAVVRELAFDLGLGDPALDVGEKGGAAKSSATVLVEVERYLTQGQTHRDPVALIAGLMESDPAGLSALLRRLGRRSGVLAMLVGTLGEAMLRRLLAVLEPDSAAVILLYLSEIGQAHRAEPLVQAPDHRLRRLLWLLTLTFQVNDAGSRFNRKSYLRSLLTGLAESEGVDYASLVATLLRGLKRTEQRINPAAALPSVVGELAEDIARSAPTFADPSAHALLEAWNDLDRPGDARTRWLDRLTALMERSPDQARKALWRIGEQAERAEVLSQALAQAMPLNRRAALWGLLRPSEQAVLEALTAALEKLPAALRPRHPPAAAILAMVLRLGEGRALTPDVLTALLRHLFGDPPPLAVRRSLRRRLALWRAAGSPPPVQLMALATALGEKADTDGAESPAPSPPVRAGEENRDRLLAALAGDEAFDPQLQDDLKTLLAAGDTGVLAAIRRLTVIPSVRRLWGQRLSGSLLQAMAQAIAPGQASDLMQMADLLTAAWRQTARDHAAPLPAQGESWVFLMDYLARTPVHSRSRAGLATAFRQYLALRMGALAARLDQVWQKTAVELARQGGGAALAQSVDQSLAAPLARSGRSALPNGLAASVERPSGRSSGKGRASFGYGDEGDNGLEEPIYIANAGLVLAGPFLPHLFTRMKWLEDDPEGKPRLRPAKLSRAVQLLQWMVDERTDHAEPALVLNKILCGIDPAVPVTAGLKLSRTERQMGLSLVGGMLANWTVISGSSPAALRETFLQRDGKLQKGPSEWRLTVQRKTVDVLVDQVPWSFSVVKHPWMALPLYVTW